MFFLLKFAWKEAYLLKTPLMKAFGVKGISADTVEGYERKRRTFKFIYLFIYGCVGSSVQGLSLVAASGDHSSSRCAGLSLSRPLLLRSTGSRRAGSVIVAHRPSCSAACGIFPDRGSNPCPLHWQADSQPLRHQGSPRRTFKTGLQSPCFRFE